MTKLEELKAKHADLKAQILAESKTCFNDMTKALFEKYPALESFSWRQYTPHFNDGDACEFSAHTSDLDFVWAGKEYEDVGRWSVEHEEYGKEYRDAGVAPAFIEALNLMKPIDEDSLKEMFGDHCRVIARRNGVEVEEYDHD